MRHALERGYIGLCTVVQYGEVVNDDHTAGHAEQVVLRDLPCKLSFESNTPVSQSDGAGAVTQTTKVFTLPDAPITAGSKLVVTQNGVTTEYQCSGQPNVYNTHLEATVVLFKEWA